MTEEMGAMGTMGLAATLNDTASASRTWILSTGEVPGVAWDLMA